MGDGAVYSSKKRESLQREEVDEPRQIDILKEWALIEADFQREYRIDLCSQLHSLSWRKFLVLLNGLSVNSTLSFVVHKSKKPSVIKDPRKAERAVKQVWGW